MPPRLNPGDVVNITGTYALIGRHDKTPRVAMLLEEGDRLPRAVADDGPLDYQLVGATQA
jgi:hypothetical protein